MCQSQNDTASKVTYLRDIFSQNCELEPANRETSINLGNKLVKGSDEINVRKRYGEGTYRERN